MTNRDGSKENINVKKCPWQLKCDECILQRELTQVIGGGQRTIRECAFNAMVMILSEINQKTPPPPQQKIQLPNIYRG